VMTSHILLPQVDPDHPATMSATVLQGLLRGELGFEGVIVSDALDMKGASGEIGIPAAAARALAAGVDLLCIGTDNSAEQLEEIAAVVTAAVADGALPAERVEDAAARVRALAARLHERAEHALLPPAPAPEPDFDLGQIARGFDVSAHARDWIAAALGEYELVRIDSVNNIAVGEAPWGLFSAGAVADAVVAPGGPVRAGDALAALGPRPVAIVGKDIHRRSYARELVDAARAERGADVLVIDMGWPGDDRAYADVATFGASRLVGSALIHLLEGPA